MKKRVEVALIASILLTISVFLLGFGILNYNSKITGKAIEFGPELINCGDFNCSSGWNLGGTWEISNEKASARYGDLKQEISLKEGKNYEVSFKIVYWRSTNGYLQPILGGVEGEKITSAKDGEIIKQKITVGSLKQGSPVYLIPQELILRISSYRGSYLNVEIDDVSVKEVSGEEEPVIPVINPNITCYSNEECGISWIKRECKIKEISGDSIPIDFIISNRTIALLKAGNNVTLKEEEIITYNQYVLLDGRDKDYLLNLFSVGNSTTGYENDYIKFRDVFTGDFYETMWVSEGKGYLTIDSYYPVSLYGASGIAAEEYEVRIKDMFPSKTSEFYCDLDNLICYLLDKNTTYSACEEHKSYTCSNPGTTDSNCSVDENLTCQDCEAGCNSETGICVNQQPEIPVETGEFIGIGESNLYKLATSNSSTLLYDYSRGDRNFIVSWDNKTINNESLTRLSYSYWLAIDFLDNSITIRDQTTGETAGNCESLSLGGKCQIRNIELTIKKLSTGKNKFAEIEINEEGSFNKVFDYNGNYMFLPELSELPTPNYSFNIFDKTDRPLEEYNFYLENGKLVYLNIWININPYESSTKIYSSTLGGDYFIVDLLNGSDNLAVSDTNTLVYNPKLGHGQFVVSSNPLFSPESYLLTVEFNESGNITLREKSYPGSYEDNQIAGNCENLSLGGKCQIGKIELTVKKLSTEEKFIGLEINEGSSFNKVFDYNGDYMFLPSYDEIKEKDYVFKIFDKKNRIIRVANIYWDNRKIISLSSFGFSSYNGNNIVFRNYFSADSGEFGLLYNKIRPDFCGDGVCNKGEETFLTSHRSLGINYNNEWNYLRVDRFLSSNNVRLYVNAILTEVLFKGQTRIVDGLPIYIKDINYYDSPSSYENSVEVILGESQESCPEDCWGGIINPEKCGDSDNGGDFFVKGNIIFESEFYEDYCQNEKRLTEYSCKENKTFSEPYDCKNGCVNGSCVQKVYLIYNDQQSPKDAGLMQDFEKLDNWLQTSFEPRGSNIKMQIIKASEVTKEMLDNSVSVFIYDGQALIIKGKNLEYTENLPSSTEVYLKYELSYSVVCSKQSSNLAGELIDNLCVPVDLYVDSCSVLNQKNKTYYLTRDLIGNEVKGRCFEITGENIVLDCQGHEIKNPNLREIAIYSEAHNVTIKNCKVEVSAGGGRGGSGMGIYVNADYNLIFDNTIENSFYGVSTNGKENHVERNKFIDNMNAIYVQGDNILIKNNLIKGKTSSVGIRVVGGASHNLENNKIYNNKIGSSFTSVNPAYSECEDYNNFEYDIYLYPKNWYNPFDRNLLISYGSTYNHTYIGEGALLSEYPPESDCMFVDCFWKDDECVYFNEVCKDNDRDRYYDSTLGCPYILATDCNDNNALVNPNRTEIPNNGIDDNCDGYMEDCPLGYGFYEPTGKCDLQIISSGTSNQENPSVYENKVVYQADRNGNWDIYMYDLETQEEKRITFNTAEQTNPVISGNKIVYQDDRNGNWDIYMVDLSAGEELELPDEGGFDFLGELPLEEVQITTDDSDQENPHIYKNKIVWEDYRSKVCKDIYMYDLETREEFKITKCGSFLPRINNQFPVIYDNIIVWDDGNWIYMCDLEKNGRAGGCLVDDEKTLINKVYQGMNAHNSFIYNNIIVWDDTNNWIYMCDLEKNGQYGGCLEGDLKIILARSIIRECGNPFVYDNKFVWQQIEQHNVNDIWIKAWEIYFCSMGRNGQLGGCLFNDVKLRITSNSFNQINPSIYGNKIIWQDNRSGNWDIYGVDLSFLSEGKSENCEIFGDEDWNGVSDCADSVCGEGVYCNKEHTKICNQGECTEPNEIRKCTTFTESGEYYLGKDLGIDELVSENCINIQAENVVFDCQGKSIRGLGKTLIFSQGKGVSIKNCNLEAVDGTAIKVEADNNLIEDTSIWGSNNAVEIDGDYSTILESEIGTNNKGVLIKGDSSFIYNNLIGENLEEGLFIDGGYSKISGNKITNNNKGIVLKDASHTRLRCNEVFDNSEYDLEIDTLSRDVVSIGDFEKKQIGWMSEFNVIEGNCEEIGVSTKNMDKYSGKEAFLVSNKDWKQVLPLVPLSVWTGNEECQRGTQTPEGICYYPSLIYHEEGYAFDENPPNFDNQFYEMEIGGEYWQEFVAKEKYLEKITLSSLAPNSNLIKIFVDVKDLDGNLIASSELMEFNADSIYFEFPIHAELTKGQKYRFYINLVEHSGGIFLEEWPDWNKPLYYSRGTDYPEGDSNLEVNDLAFTLQYEKDTADNFDADSIVYFLQQYSPDRVTIVGGTLEEVDNLLIAGQDFGAGLEESQIQRINSEDYLSYWQEIGQIVYVENDYEKALLASTYASLINSPLVIKGTKLDDIEDCGAETCIFDNQNIILVGNVPCPKTAFYCEMYSLEKLQEKYLELTNTNKVMLVNPQDLEINELFREGVSTKTSEINELFTKTSLASPFLASAKHELIIPVGKQDYVSVNSLFKNKLSELDFNPEYLTIVATPNAISYRAGSASFAADTSVYADFDSDNLLDLAVGRIMSLTTSDVSSYIARALSYNELEKTENVKFIAGGLTWDATENRPLKGADLLAKKFNIGYNSQCSIYINEYGCGTDRACPISYGYYNCNEGYSPNDWIDQSFIAWIDHGQVNAAGIPSWEIPNLKLSLMFSKACATCALENSYDKESFCLIAIRKGSIGYIGNIAGSDSSDWKLAGFLNGVYYYDLSIGEALKNSFNGYEYQRTTILVGDPTLKIDVPYKLDTPIRTGGTNLEWW